MKTLDAITRKVAIVIPCHNEASSIGQVIAKFPREELMRHAIQLEIYVVDNNCSDNTAAIAEKMGATVVREPQKGKGHALRAGFRSVPNDADYVVMLDGDDTYCPQEIMRLLEPLLSDFCDVVVGSRLGGHIQTAAMSRLNRVGNRLFTSAVRAFYGANVTDVLTGYFAWKKPALDALNPHITSTGFAVEMEMITKMARLGNQMASVPISYNPRAGESHLHPFRDGARILRMLLKNLNWRPARAPKPPDDGPPNTATPVKPALTAQKMVFVSDAIYPYMKGGKEKRLHELTRHLAAMGHDVHIYTMHWWDEPARTRTESGVHLHALCRYHEMYHGDRRTIWEGLIFGLACFKLMVVRFDVLDVDHMPFFPIFSSWIVCKLRDRKLSATWHEALSHQDWIDYMGPSGVLAAGVERISTRLPHRITAASAHTKELLASIHGRVERVELVASGIDTSAISAVASAQVACDVLYVGRLVKDKNVDKLIAAISIVALTFPKVRCLIVGRGIEKDRLQQQVAQLKLQKNVGFLEELASTADVYAHMKAAKVFCSPSVREGFGITTLEALGCGTPVITADSPGNAARHLIQDGHNGSVVELTPSAIAGAILCWISLSEKPDIAILTTAYDWDQLAKKQAEVYLL